MALVGYHRQSEEIGNKIAHLRQLLWKATGHPLPDDVTVAAMTRRTKRKMSASTRRRIAAAQKKRWTDYRKKKASRSRVKS